MKYIIPANPSPNDNGLNIPSLEDKATINAIRIAKNALGANTVGTTEYDLTGIFPDFLINLTRAWIASTTASNIRYQTNGSTAIITIAPAARISNHVINTNRFDCFKVSRPIKFK